MPVGVLRPAADQVRDGEVRAHHYASGTQRQPYSALAGRDLFDRVIVLNEQHCRRLLREYVADYHDDRTHSGTQLGDSRPTSDGSVRFGRQHHVGTAAGWPASSLRPGCVDDFQIAGSNSKGGVRLKT